MIQLVIKILKINFTSIRVKRKKYLAEYKHNKISLIV
jgi:hypothetical protein